MPDQKKIQNKSGNANSGIAKRISSESRLRVGLLGISYDRKTLRDETIFHQQTSTKLSLLAPLVVSIMGGILVKIIFG